MRPKNFTLAVLIVVLAGMGIWWFLRPAATVPEKTASAPAPSKTTVPSLSKIEAPKQVAPPAPNSAAAPVAATPPKDPNAGSRIELNAALTDMANLYRTNNLVAILRAYTPPDKIHEDRVQALQAQQDQIQARVDAMGRQGKEATQHRYEARAQAFEALLNQAPIFNAAGDEATYIYTTPSMSDLENGAFTTSDIHNSLVFVKINGKWYMKPDDAGN